jgi:hypothetical protein
MCTVSHEHANRFATGDTIVIVWPVRWYVRAWRWVTRYRPPVYTVAKVDRQLGAITWSQVIYDAEEGK